MRAAASASWELLRPRQRGAPGKTICVANQKGGVAKTTTAVNLAAALALRGHPVLVVDCDPQGNASTGVGIGRASVESSTYDLLLGDATLAEVARATAIEHLHCAPASLDLAGAEIELVGSLERELKLRDALVGASDRYELVFLDCPPSLGLLTVNALAAADDLIVPVQCEYYALEGLGQMLDTAERVRRVLNPSLRVSGFLLTMYDARTNLAAQVADEVRSHFGDLVYETLIPRSVRLSEAPSFGEPVLTLDPSSRGAVAYRLLAVEVESRYGLEVRVPPPPPPRERPETGPSRSVPGEPVDITDDVVAVTPSSPGPGGRGYGTVSPEPAGLDDAWPRPLPWGSDR